MPTCLMKVTLIIVLLILTGFSYYFSFVKADDKQDVTTTIQELIKSPVSEEAYKLYPFAYDEKPELPSPFKTSEGREYVVVFTKDKNYSIIPVTVENRDRNPNQRHPYLKGNQLKVDEEDFPTLAATGLHSDQELLQTKTITGKPVDEITRIGRPEVISVAGFMAEDEDIISVLKADNLLVGSMGLTHPEMARPLYHMWNILLLQYDLGIAGRKWEPFEYILYNGVKVKLMAEGSRGFQESIFNDEIRGAIQIWLSRDLSDAELIFLKTKYSHLDAKEMAEMVDALTHLHTGEMVPYYIMRYGFYEGHTGYRADPIAITFIFRRKNLEEIETAFNGKLFEALSEHYKTGVN